MDQIKFNGGGQGASRVVNILPYKNSKRQRALALINTFTQTYPQPPPYPDPPVIRTRLPDALLRADQSPAMNAWLVANAPDLVNRKARLGLINQERARFRVYLSQEAQYQAALVPAAAAADIQLNSGDDYYRDWIQLYDDVFRLVDLRDDLNDLLISIYTMAVQYMDDIYHEYARRYAVNPIPMNLNGRNVFHMRYLQLRIALMRLTGNVPQMLNSQDELEDLEVLMQQFLPLSQQELPRLDDTLTAFGKETDASVSLRQPPLMSGFITAQDRRRLTLEEQHDQIQNILRMNNPPLTPQQITDLRDDDEKIHREIITRNQDRRVFMEHRNRKGQILSRLLTQNRENSHDPAFEPPRDVPEVLIRLWIRSDGSERRDTKESMRQWVMENRPDIAKKGVDGVEAYLNAEIERTQDRRPSARERYEQELVEQGPPRSNRTPPIAASWAPCVLSPDLPSCRKRYEKELAAYNMAVGRRAFPAPPSTPDEEGGGNKQNKKSCSKNKCKKNMKKQFGGKWSLKYKKSINCNRPKGFSQKQHCKYRNKNTRKNNK